MKKTNILDKPQNNNQAGQVIIICEDNEEDVNINNNEDIEEVSNDINIIDENIYNNESNNDLNDEDYRINLNIIYDSENK